jgi:hypothetical protein
LHAIGVLLAGGTDEEAAAAAQVTVRTLRRWRAADEFQNALREFARASFRQAHSQLMGLVGEALATLAEMNRTGTPAIRTRAALALVDLGIKVADGDLDERLERLEEAWQQTNGGEPNGLQLLSS